ncbi:hypothetical protein EAE99_006493 [Botrytis elliptica]|nr:hypothetical protein EAE99_006493 [Botrytis elliptica]
MGTPKALLMQVPFLCESCREVDIVNTTHRYVYDMFGAANNGCVLCDIVLKSLKLQEPEGRLFDSLECFVECHVSIPKHEITWRSYFHQFSLDDPLAERVLLRPISTDVSSKESFNLISIWLRQCILHHKECRNRGEIDKRLPSRVIDVRSEGEDPLLVETNQRHGNWVALSYCWGSSPTTTTTRRNFQQYCNKIPMSALPHTIKDAIIITRRLGYQFLWIDSLCIVQDSPEDWAVESLKMADVYGGASLTIAAEAAIDTASGIFDSTNVLRQQQSQNFNFSVKGYHPVYPRDNGRLYLRDSVDLQPSSVISCLKKRAWALQEDLMSRRLISFGKEQLY